MRKDYPYGETIQIKLVSLLAKDPDENLLKIIQPQFFNHPILREISGVLKEAHAGNAKPVPVDKSTLKELLRGSVGNNDGWPAYKRMLTDIYELPDPPDRQIIVSQAHVLPST